MTEIKKNPKTGLEMYPYGYWRFMFKDTNNWFLFLFTMFLWIGSTLQVYITEGELFGYSHLFLIFVGVGLFYNWYCWREQQKGETS